MYGDFYFSHFFFLGQGSFDDFNYMEMHELQVGRFFETGTNDYDRYGSTLPALIEARELNVLTTT